MSTNTANPSTTLVIREATGADRSALTAVAQRDSRALPAGRVLVAEADGVMRAAIAIDSGLVIADPFHPTTELVALLRTRARQLSYTRHSPLRITARTPLAGVAAG